MTETPDDHDVTEAKAIEHFNRTGVIIPGHQGTIAKHLRTLRGDGE